jgi:hypothetical protein
VIDPFLSSAPLSSSSSTSCASASYVSPVKKSVSFQSITSVILIPKKEEYEEAKLIEKLWWSEKDFNGFKTESCQEIREFIAKKLHSSSTPVTSPTASSPSSSSRKREASSLPATAIVTSPLTGERRLQCSKEDAKKIIRLYFEDFFYSLEEEEQAEAEAETEAKEMEDLLTCSPMIVEPVPIEMKEEEQMVVSRPRGLSIQLDELKEDEEQQAEEEEGEEEYEFMHTVLTPATSPLPGHQQQLPDFPSSSSTFVKEEELKDLSSINNPLSDMKFQDHFDEFHRMQQQTTITPPPDVILPFSPAPSSALRKITPSLRSSQQQQQLKTSKESQLLWFNDEDQPYHSFFRLNFLSVIVAKLMTFGGLYIILNHQRKST